MGSRGRCIISRELTRNCDPVSGSYTPGAAHARAVARRPRPKARKVATNDQLCEHVRDKLELRWSPEQISQRLPLEFPDQPAMRIAPETIYQTPYTPGRPACGVT